MRLSRQAVAILSLVLALGCGSRSVSPVGGAAVDSPSLPAGSPDIVGTITKVLPASGDKPLRILVEAGDQKDVVSVMPGTRLLRDDAGTLREAASTELVEGARVSAWYDGAVKESYPRQANAVAIVISGKR